MVAANEMVFGDIELTDQFPSLPQRKRYLMNDFFKI